MKIKNRKRTESQSWLLFKKILTGKTLKNFIKKTAILFLILLFLAIFIFGNVSGFLLGSFFSNRDSFVPNLETTLRELHLDGFLFFVIGFKKEFYHFKEENIKIPINYLKGKFSHPPRIYIDMDFEDYKTLTYYRNSALGTLTYKSPLESNAGLLSDSEKKYIPANIRYQGDTLKAEVRLKGDYVDHIEGEKWSLRIKLKGDNRLNGMSIFSIQDPKTKNRLDQFVYHKLLKKEDVMSLRYSFVEVVVNGDYKGIFALEEHFSKELIETNHRREGILLNFKYDFNQEVLAIADSLDSTYDYSDYYAINNPYWFYNSYINAFRGKKIQSNPDLSAQFYEGAQLLELFRAGKLKTSEAFDIDILAKHFAIITLFGDTHSFSWDNIRFYYNPITKLLEPVGYDASNIKPSNKVLERYFLPYLYLGTTEHYQEGKTSPNELKTKIFNDELFFKKYISELDRVSEKSYLDEAQEEFKEELKRAKRIIHKDNPMYHFSFEQLYLNQEIIKQVLQITKGLKAYLQEKHDDKVVLYISNNNNLPIEIKSVSNKQGEIFLPLQAGNILPAQLSPGLSIYKKYIFPIPLTSLKQGKEVLKIQYSVLGLETIHEEEVLSWAYPGNEDQLFESNIITSNIQSANILVADESTKTLSFRKEKTGQDKITLREELVIPTGYTLIIEPGTTIDIQNGARIVSYSAILAQGTANSPIKFTSSDGKGRGLIVLKADGPSKLSNIIIENQKYPWEESWQLTGAVTFYESPLVMDKVSFYNIVSEDVLNIVRSSFSLNQIYIKGSSSDCIDVDFSKGLVTNSQLIDCGNDGLDFSGSVVEVRDIIETNIGDKGISVGENSKVVIKDLSIDGSFIGVASKDLAYVYVEGVKIKNSDYGFSIYQKKPEFGPAEIVAKDAVIIESTNPNIIEKSSLLTLEGTKYKGTEKKVYETLYGNE